MIRYNSVWRATKRWSNYTTIQHTKSWSKYTTDKLKSEKINTDKTQLLSGRWEQYILNISAQLAARPVFVCSIYHVGLKILTHKIATKTCTIRRGVWNLPHKFHLYLIVYYNSRLSLVSLLFKLSLNSLVQNVLHGVETFIWIERKPDVKYQATPKSTPC